MRPGAGLRVAASCVFCLCIAWAAGCAPAAETGESRLFDPCQPLELVPDSSATAVELDSIDAAARAWNLAAGTQLTLGPAGVEVDTTDLAIHFESAAPQFFGIYEPVTGEIFVNRLLPSGRARDITIAHELGHAFGLEHVSDYPSVMNPGNLDTGVNQDDVAVLGELWGACAAP